MEIQPFQIKDQVIRTNEDGLVCLTDLHNASGKTANYNPYNWGRKDGADFIAHIAKKLNKTASLILQTRKGKGGGTYAHPQIALAYAKYLSHELHEEVNRTFLRAKAGDVTLAEEIADKASPENQLWLARRMNGKVARLDFTGELQFAGVTVKGYALCTNSIYTPLLGGTASQLKKRRNLPERANLRDNMSIKELTAVALAEMVSAEKIRDGKIQGDIPCANACYNVAEKIKQAIQ